MFSTFSGSSRRPRQVNLSGQNTNPFAKAGSPGGTASGTQQAIAAAQHERQRRQQERDRLSASRTIQRTWRGHKVRKELADSRRRQWDELKVDLPQRLIILLAFMNPRRSDDRERLEKLASMICERPGVLNQVQPQLARLSVLTLHALQEAASTGPARLLLHLLVEVIDARPTVFLQISRPYYEYLRKLDQVDVVESAIRAPLMERIDVEGNDEIVLEAYGAFALQFLASPTYSTDLSKLEFVDVGRLSTALIKVFADIDRLPVEGKLYLLANFIGLHRNQQGNNQEPEFLRALSLQLSSSSTEIVRRIDLTAADFDEDHMPFGLDPFVKEELMSLVDQASITGLLTRFNIDHTKSSAAVEEDASLLSSYALTLLRIFPRRSDEIRMWLYLGSMTTANGVQLPAVKYFWQAMAFTNIFSVIRENSKAALAILQPQYQSSTVPVNIAVKDREWRTILLFLELYSFVLRFTDDEEFLNGSDPNIGEEKTSSMSRIRESALPLEDVKQLSLFLKNLAFTAYFNAAELSDDDQHIAEQISNSATYFSSPATQKIHDIPSIPGRATYRPFAGIAGMTFSYVRTIAAGVMRMLYERDSRRRFLPKGHWLMTSRFDMEGFIPAVVAEEERRLAYGGEDDESGDDQYDFGIEETRDRDRALVGMSRPRRARQIEDLRKQQQLSARKKHLAQVGPRLEVLQNMPFAIPFETRVQIFRQFVHLDQVRRRGGHVDPDIWRMSMVQQAMLAHTGPHRPPGREVLGRHHAKIRRDQVFEDALDAFYQLGEGLKEPIQITFVDKFDTVEAGIDGGGVTKEFLTSITNEAFRAEKGPNLFVANDQNLLYPNPSKLDDCREFMRQAGLSETDEEWKEGIREVLQQYEFLGRIVGKCLYESILIDVSFAGFFLLKWAASGATSSESAYRANINDLRDLDEGLYQGLLKLKNYTGNVSDLSLDFTIDDKTFISGESTRTITRELVPGGSGMAVTNENRPLYMSYIARHRLLVQPYQQTQAFLRGLGEIIKPSWMSMFNQTELQTLIGGDSSEIDVEDLRRNTEYGGVYQIGDDGLEHPTIQLFWKVFKDLEDSDRRAVLKYVTSTPRAPLLGFSQLNPLFSIRDAGGDEERLPSTSTCVNLLKLPRYSTATILRNKLLYAVNSGAGFDLS